MEKNKINLRPRQRIRDVPSRTRRKADTCSSSTADTAASSTSEQHEKNKATSASSSTVTSSNLGDTATPDAAAGATAATSSPRGAGSPEPNCAICLGKLENKSFTDSCFHMFCFVCLVEWSKVKAECPLCKQPFKSIVHNVRNYEDYEQYHIPRPEDSAARQTRQHMWSDVGMFGGVRFRYRTTVTDHRYAHIADRLDQELTNRLFHRPSQREPHYRRRRQVANSDFRRSVYQQRLRLSSEVTTRRRVRETSPTFYRENSAQTHRLVPWLNRELNALLPGHGEQSAFVMELIMDLIKRFQINSEEFHQHIYPFIGRNTRQFMSEFLAFARSPYHMAAYDRHVAYEQNDQPNHDSDSDHDRSGIVNDGNDSDVIVVSPSHSPVLGGRTSPPSPSRYPQPGASTHLLQGFHTFLDQPPFFHPIVRSQGQEDLTSLRDEVLRFPPTRFDRPPGASGWDSPTPGTSLWMNDDLNPSMSQSTSANSSIWTPSSTSFSAPTTPLMPHLSLTSGPCNPAGLSPIPSTSQGNPIVCHETESDSDSGDVMIVDYEKPWTERSPIKLSSAEESDPDLVIVGMTHINDPVKKEKKKKRKHDKGDRDSERSHEKRQKRDTDYNSSYATGHGASGRSPDFTRFRLHLGRQRSHSRSRSRSPSYEALRLRLPGYKHKKFSYYNDESKDRHVSRPHDSRTKSHTHSSKTHHLSSSESDTESRVSFTSRKHSSNSRHSSIEILEYRKKSSKYKKVKKYRKEKDGHSTERKKHKKEHKKKGDELTKHKKSKKKHKKESAEKHKKKEYEVTKGNESKNDSTDSNVIRDAGSVAGTVERVAHSVSEYTSDSEPDSDINVTALDAETEDPGSKTDEKAGEMVDKDSDKTDRSKSMFDGLGLEFVELSSDQAALLDAELETINDSIAEAGVYGDLVFPNLPKQKTFKKHPHGHKKSSKTSSASSESSSNQLSEYNSVDGNVQVVNSVVPQVPINVDVSTPKNKHDDSVQSNDITSSDIDVDKYLPSFLSFVDKTTDYNNMVNEQCKLLQPYTSECNKRSGSHTHEITPDNPSTSIKVVATAGYASPVKPRTVSESSDEIDVTGTDGPVINSFKRHCSSGFEVVNSHVSTVESPQPGCSKYIEDDLDVVGVSDTESVVEYLGEEKASIDITGDSESETDTHTVHDSDTDIDIVAHSDDECKLDTTNNVLPINKNNMECDITDTGAEQESNINISCDDSSDCLKSDKDESRDHESDDNVIDESDAVSPFSNMKEDTLDQPSDDAGPATVNSDNDGTDELNADGFDNTSLKDVRNNNDVIDKDSDDNTVTGEDNLICGRISVDSADDTAVESTATIGEGSSTQPAVDDLAPSTSELSNVTPTPRLAWTNNPLFEPGSPTMFSSALNESFSTTPGSSPPPDSGQYISTYVFPQSPSPLSSPSYSPDINISDDSMAPED